MTPIKMQISARRLSRGFIVAVLLTTCAVRAEDASSKTTQGAAAAKLQRTDASSFIKEAAQANQTEVAFAEVAEPRAQNPAVKQFAAMMRRDHQSNNEQLQPVAKAHGVEIPQSLDAKHQKKLSDLQQMSGTEFDQAYVKDMLKGHQKNIAKFEQAIQQVDDADVKQYARATLPALRQHLQHAKRTAQEVGIDQDTITSILKESGGMGASSDNMEKESGSGTTLPRDPMTSPRDPTKP